MSASSHRIACECIVIRRVCAAQKHQFEDLYPSLHLRRRALIDQYLHWHHENTRKVTGGFLRVLLRPDTRIDAVRPAALRNTRKLAKYALAVIEGEWLEKHEFIVDDALSLADILCFEELVQLKQWPLIAGAEQTYPNIFRWIGRMERVKGYAQTHRILAKLDGFIAKRVKQCAPLLAKL